MKMGKIVHYVSLVALGYFSLTLNLVAQAVDAAQADNKIEQIDFATLPGDKLNIKIKLAQPMANPPAGFTMSNPARIALDFPNTTSGLTKNALTVNQGTLRSLNVAQGKNRTRLVLNLTKSSSYSARVDGSTVSIDLQSGATGVADAGSVTRFAEAAQTAQPHQINNVDFVRGKNGEGRVIVDLSDSATGIDIRQQGQKILVDFLDSSLPENLHRRLNVTDFATPVLHVDTMRSGKNVRLTIEPKGLWEHSAYQADNKFIVDVRPLVEDPNKLTQGSKAGYKGEKLSLNFQDIEVRSVLQVIADFTGFNIITSDSVSGKLTLRLKDVPWDQALDLILQTRGLGMRKNGNVVWIAPNEELAAKEKSRLDAEQEIADREPLVTHSFIIKYQKAEDIRAMLVGSGTGSSASGSQAQRLISKRGSVTLDKHTNTVFVLDTEKKLIEIEQLINRVDVATRQVLIQARLVSANKNFSKDLGARFGIQKKSGNFGIAPNIATSNNLAQGNNPSSPQLNVNLPVPATKGPGTLALSFFRLPASLLIDLELSASEADGKTKVISSPSITTVNQKPAEFSYGQTTYVQIIENNTPSSDEVEALLKLKVTPQITPDNEVNMDIELSDDSIAGFSPGTNQPIINRKTAKTVTRVSNGETAVIGGFLRNIDSNKTDKIPFFGDLPLFGHLFKRTGKEETQEELLFFITPSIVDEKLSVRN